MVIELLRTVKNTLKDIQKNKLYSTKFNSQIEQNTIKEISRDCISIGSHSRLIGNIINGNISVGSYTWITKSRLISKSTSVKVGNYTLMQDQTQAIAKHNNITIGNFCTIGLGTALASFAHCFQNYTSSYLDKRTMVRQSTKNSYSVGEVIIGHDCLIGRRSYVGPGVSLGNGCIALPNSVITTSFEPYSIIAGSPAKKIGKRYSNRKIEYLKELNWYEWEHQKIVDNMDALLSNVEIAKTFI